ncbi:hypothetical protein MRX96_035356 [Rhipicephalus microplus]
MENCDTYAQDDERASRPNLLDLPSEIIEKILRHTNFATISNTRMVCHHLNDAASGLLNSEFVRLRGSMQQRFQAIKAQMPRRESARRKHPLSRECDIIETVHMRLTLLQMTFGKHIERKHCCFFPGEILDEVHRILRYVEVTPTLSRAYKVTDELFDLTTMAMEYFKEHIEPTLPEISYFAADFLDYPPCLKNQSLMESLFEPPQCTSMQGSSSSAPQSPQPPPVNPTVKKRLRKLRESMKKNSGQVLALRRELKLTRRTGDQPASVHCGDEGPPGRLRPEAANDIAQAECGAAGTQPVQDGASVLALQVTRCANLHLRQNHSARWGTLPRCPPSTSHPLTSRRRPLPPAHCRVQGR